MTVKSVFNDSFGKKLKIIFWFLFGIGFQLIAHAASGCVPFGPVPEVLFIQSLSINLITWPEKPESALLTSPRSRTLAQMSSCCLQQCKHSRMSRQNRVIARRTNARSNTKQIKKLKETKTRKSKY